MDKPEVNEDTCTKWFLDLAKEFEFNVVDDDFLKHLAYALCNDCPMGYDASHRLASWIFSYLKNKEYHNLSHFNEDDKKALIRLIKRENSVKNYMFGIFDGYWSEYKKNECKSVMAELEFLYKVKNLISNETD